MKSRKVLITRRIPDKAEKLLKKKGFDVVIGADDKGLSKNELVRLGRDADGIISMLSDKFDESVIKKLHKCKVIANYAVGFNNIDLKAAKEYGIAVTNTPDILTDATADIAMGLAVAAARNFIAGDKIVRDGKFDGWKPLLMLGSEFRGKTFGIIGAGRIGQATARRAAAFGSKIIYYNRSKKADFEKELGAKKVSLNKLIATSDFISIHLPLTEKTFHILNTENMRNLKKGVVIVNTARGEVIDEKELIKLLKNGTVFAAGLDVYENEPKVKRAFLKLNNVILLPHIGTATFEARNKMAELTAQNVINVLKGKTPVTPVL